VVSALNTPTSESLVLDAGAGECRLKKLLKNKTSVAIDAAW